MDRIKNFVRPQAADEEEGGIMNEVNQVVTLSWATRLKCFAACFILGVLLSLLGSLLWYLGNWKGFGILFTFGSVTSIASTCFLMGPWSQLKKMFALTRLVPTIVVFLMIGLTLCAALWWHNGVLVLLFVVIQYLALAWYSISYIPFARDAVEKCACACLD